RGDYQGAAQRLGDAELTYALETAQGFSIYSFFKAYAIQILAGLAMLGLITTIVFIDIRFWTIDNELSQLSKEEEIVLGLIKEVQQEYFEQGKLSTEEFYSSIEQYEGRLAKIVQRKIELDTSRRNYFTFGGKNVRLRAERQRLEQLIAELQRAYLEQGKIETRVYEKRMNSYISRLSEIEEALAIDDADARIKKSRRLFGLLDREKPPMPPSG
ncbi:MAG: hypothetical protein QW568_05260, partial [Candidatus Anstonellaceae archaeon]